MAGARGTSADAKAAPRATGSGRANGRARYSYWHVLLGFAGALLALHLLLRPSPGRHTHYTTLLGAVGLALEAALPLPQMHANHAAQSCRGFRPSVLANWLFGDAMKMAFFFLSPPGAVPGAFKACGVFQALCDVGLGVQWWVYGDGPEEGRRVVHLA